MGKDGPETEGATYIGLYNGRERRKKGERGKTHWAIRGVVGWALQHNNKQLRLSILRYFKQLHR